MTSPRSARGPRSSADRRWAWALFAAFTVHNAEEAATMAGFLDDGAGGFGRVLGLGPELLGAWFVAVSAVTLAALGVVLAATGPAPRRWAAAGLRVLAVVMVVNVLVPHVPAAVATGGYVPGLVSSVLLTLPLCAAFLLRGRRRGRAPARH